MSRRRGYKFTNKRHTRQGMISSGLGLCVLLLVSGLFYLSYARAGEVGDVTGFLGFIAMLASIVGLWMGVKGCKEEGSFYLFSYIGCILNGVLLVIFILLYILGM